MPTCLKCGYELTLLARGKYKCSLCSRLYFTKRIESRTFRIWNKKQSELDIHNFKLEFEKGWNKMKELKSSIKQMFKSSLNYDKKEQWSLWRLRNIEKVQEKERRYYAKNKDKINEKRRLRWKLNNANPNTLRKLRRDKDRAFIRLQSRIDYWKQQQKALADAYSENEQYKDYKAILDNSVPTFELCELLALTQSLKT